MMMMVVMMMVMVMMMIVVMMCASLNERTSALTSSRILQPKSLDMTKQTLNG